ncbi:MAG: zf-HC2 domain-containing protein [Betaproteobacteria bacterium]
MLRRLLGHLLMCKDATRLLSRAQDEPLSSFQRWRLDAHLMACDLCARFESQLRFLREAVRRYKA